MVVGLALFAGHNYPGNGGANVRFWGRQQAPVSQGQGRAGYGPALALRKAGGFNGASTFV